MKYVALDYHKKFSHATMIDTETGKITHEQLDNDRQKIRDFIGDGRNTVAVLEAGRCWGWMHEVLDETCDEVKLAHPYKVKAIAWARIKNDKIDSRTLAELLSADLIPEAHARNTANRQALSVIRHRVFWVRIRTRIKNRIHQLVDRQGPETAALMPACSDLFGKAGMAWLRAVELEQSERIMLDSLLAGIDFVNEQIKHSDQQLRHLYACDPVAQRLSTIPGIGVFFATLISREIDCIERFATPEQLHSYAGLVPSTYSSGNTIRHGRLTKQGNRWLRWAAVEAAMPAVRADWQLASFYYKYKRRKGAKVAKIVVARRLLSIAFRIWKQNREFEPCRKGASPRIKKIEPPSGQTNGASRPRSSKG